MTPLVIFGEYAMLQSIKHILHRNLHLGFTLDNTVLERTQKDLNGYLSEFQLHLNFLLNWNDCFWWHGFIQGLVPPRPPTPPTPNLGSPLISASPPS